MLYHVSYQYLGKKTILYPRVPINSMTRKGFEDNHTGRVCFCPTVQKCLMALSKNIKGQTFSVYIPDIDEQNLEKVFTIYRPTINQVPDVKITEETWILEKIPVRLVATIRVDDAKDTPYLYNYGADHSTALYEWNYTIIQYYTTKGANCHGL